MSISPILQGNNAFYNIPNYEEVTRNELSSAHPLEEPVYSHTTESKVWRVAKLIFSLIIFPIAICHLLHKLAGYLLLPAATYSAEDINNFRVYIPSDADPWKVKRITVEVDGANVDAMLVGTEKTLENGRWTLFSNGNGQFYETKFREHNFTQILSKLDSNALIFNYPGVGASQGMPDRQAMAKAYRAMLRFLENKEQGIGADEIIGYGLSIGGGVQGEALKDYSLQEGIRYAFVKDRTFSDLSAAAYGIGSRANNTLGLFLSVLVKIFGWNIRSVESSEQLQAPEIIIQTSNAEGEVIGDGVISKEAALASHLAKTPNRHFVKVMADHNGLLVDEEIDQLVERINSSLRESALAQVA